MAPMGPRMTPPRPGMGGPLGPSYGPGPGMRGPGGPPPGPPGSGMPPMSMPGPGRPQWPPSTSAVISYFLCTIFDFFSSF